MKIESYSFGAMVIGGKRYEADLIVYPDRIDASWWRRQGHNLCLEDLADVLRAKPAVLIVGTGESAMMQVAAEVKTQLAAAGIDLRTAPTPQAVEIFNGLSGSPGVVAAFHLTC